MSSTVNLSYLEKLPSLTKGSPELIYQAWPSAEVIYDDTR